mgnify:CR=1 FL=1
MSTLKVDSIVDGGGSGAPTAPNGLTVGTTAIPTSGALSNRNLIINGAMQVAQRGTSVTVGSGTYLCDRFFCTKTGTAALTYEQSSDAPDGFNKSAKITVDTAQALQASDYTQFTTHIEGYDISHLGLGTPQAKQITLSFWVKSSLTGSFGLALANGAVDKNYVTSYSISSASTWEYKTITLTGAVDGTWVTNNTRAFSIYWDLGIGPTYSTSTQDTWITAFNFGLNGAVKLKETAGATFQITGVQLELGDTATPFEHRSYGDELAKCQRYYYRWGFSDAYFSSGTIPFQGYADSVAGIDIWQNYNVEMRARPSITVSGTWSSSNVSSFYGRFQNRQGFSIRYEPISTGSCYVYANSADDYFEHDAEL